MFCKVRVRLGCIGLTVDDGFLLRQADIGDLLGRSLVHVNRVMQRLRADNVIATESTRLRLLDVPRLEALAEFDSDYLHLPFPAPP